MASESELILRIVVVAPPEGVRFAAQQGKSGLMPPTAITPSGLIFDIPLRVGVRPDGRPNFLGPFAHGSPDDRFVYINSGTLAGGPGSPWTRRAKVKIADIPWERIEALGASPEARLEGHIAGRGKDGGPACASVPLLGDGWQITTGEES